METDSPVRQICETLDFDRGSVGVKSTFYYCLLKRTQNLGLENSPNFQWQYTFLDEDLPLNNKLLCEAGLFCVKEAVYNVLLEAADTDTWELTNRQISERLGIERSFKDSDSYTLIRGILDVLYREERVERVDKNGGKMIWRITQKE